MPKLTVQGIPREVPMGTNLYTALLDAGIPMDAPCGGNGKCGKCKVIANGKTVPACRTAVTEDLFVTLPQWEIPSSVVAATPAAATDIAIAFDIGTTSVAGYLLNGATGEILAATSIPNPQSSFGADVISRIRAALNGRMEQLQESIRSAMNNMIQSLCTQTGAKLSQIRTVSVVGNCCMQQLFLGILPENLAQIPYAPVLTEAKTEPAVAYLPGCYNAVLLTVPDIGGFVGADTVGCVLSTGMDHREEMTLLVDIGTNGEMVLGNRHRMIACSTAAGPALEGAGIQFGMRAADGAIDHVWQENGGFRCSVIGGGTAKGICGSGLIDAVAVALELGLLNKRGRIQNEARRIHLTDEIELSQEDIRQVQLAKGAICAGIRLMAQKMGIRLEDISQVLLAGAFGSYLDPANACRIGLLPAELAGKITAVGNAAGSGACMLAEDPRKLALTQDLADKIEFLELASLPDFPGVFARSMHLKEGSL